MIDEATGDRVPDRSRSFDDATGEWVEQLFSVQAEAGGFDQPEGYNPMGFFASEGQTWLPLPGAGFEPLVLDSPFPGVNEIVGSTARLDPEQGWVIPLSTQYAIKDALPSNDWSDTAPFRNDPVGGWGADFIQGGGGPYVMMAIFAGAVAAAGAGAAAAEGAAVAEGVAVAEGALVAPVIETGAFDMGLFTAADVGLAPAIAPELAAVVELAPVIETGAFDMGLFTAADVGLAPVIETGAFDMGLFTAADVGLAPAVEGAAATTLSLPEVVEAVKAVQSVLSPVLAIGRALRGALAGDAPGRDASMVAGAWSDTPAASVVSDSLWTAGAFAGLFVLFSIAGR